MKIQPRPYQWKKSQMSGDFAGRHYVIAWQAKENQGIPNTISYEFVSSKKFGLAVAKRRKQIMKHCIVEFYEVIN